MKYTFRLLSLLTALIMLISAASPCVAQESQTVIFDSASGIGNCVVANVGTSTENLHENSVYAVMKKLSGGAELGKVETLDLSAHGYINMWLYSPLASSGKFTLDVYNDIDGTRTRTGRVTYTADWQGWKLISTALDTMPDVDWSALTKWRITTYGTASSWTDLADHFIGIEKVWLSENYITLPEAKAFYPAYGSRNVSPFDTSVIIDFNNPLMPVNAGDVILQSGGTVCENALSVSSEGGRVEVAIADLLLPDTDYTLSIGAVKDIYGQYALQDTVYSFRTASAGVAASKVVFYDEDGNPVDILPGSGSVSAEATVINCPEAEAANPVLIAVLYKSDGTMINVHRAFLEEGLAPGASAELDITVTAEELAEASEIRAFVSAADSEPSALGDRYAQLGAEAMAETPTDAVIPEEFEISVNKPEVADNILTLSGEVNTPGSKIVMQLKNAAGELVYLTPVSVAGDGAFEVRIPVSFGGGIYTFTAFAAEKTAEAQELHYMSEAERERVLDGINTAEDSNEIEEIIAPYLFSLNLDLLPEEDMPDVANWLLGGAPYEKFDDIGVRASLYTEVRTALEECIWSELPEFFENYGEQMFSDSEQYEYYCGLKSEAKGIICEKLAKSLPPKSIAEFCSDFEDAVDDYKKDLKAAEDKKESTSGNKGGGGGGGGKKTSGLSGSYTIPVTPPAVEIQPPAPEAPSADTPVFSDISGVSWAHEAISFLHSEGVISDASDGRFRPDDQITREEFVKMLVCAFDADLSRTDCSFADVQPDAWYLPYLSAAEADGMVCGFEDGTFGVGVFITRQDMAVMVHRALQNRALADFAPAECAFGDEAMIADYAYDAVTALCSMGIVEGDGNNMFNPEQHLTRAETAQVIYRIMNLGR